MRDAVALATFYLNGAARLAGEATISRETADAESMRVWLVQQWADPFISVTDAVQRGPGHLREATKVTRVFDLLEQHGWLQPAGSGRPGA